MKPTYSRVILEDTACQNYKKTLLYAKYSSGTVTLKINTEMKDVTVNCNNPLTHAKLHNSCAQCVELYSLIVIPAAEQANEGV